MPHHQRVVRAEMETRFSGEDLLYTRILYVDDDPVLRRLVGAALESADPCYVVETCASGSEALAKAPAFAPDLALLDVEMPGMDGPTTLATLRADLDLRDLPAIFLTGTPEAAPAPSPDNGVLAVVVKGQTKEDLIETVLSAWSSRQDTSPDEDYESADMHGPEFWPPRHARSTLRRSVSSPELFST